MEGKRTESIVGGQRRGEKERKKKANFKHRPYFHKQLMPENRRRGV